MSHILTIKNNKEGGHVVYLGDQEISAQDHNLYQTIIRRMSLLALLRQDPLSEKISVEDPVEDENTLLIVRENDDRSMSIKYLPTSSELKLEDQEEIELAILWLAYDICKGNIDVIATIQRAIKELHRYDGISERKLPI